MEDVIPEHLLNAAVLGIITGHNEFGIVLDQLRAGGKHAGRDHLQPGARDQPRENTASARFVERIGSNDDVGQLLQHRGGQLDDGVSEAAGAGETGAAGGVEEGGAALPPRILNMTVPQVGHLPLMARRPFFITSSTASTISFLALHLTQ